VGIFGLVVVVEVEVGFDDDDELVKTMGRTIDTVSRAIPTVIPPIIINFLYF
jgi:hypothetical protein